ncbi:MAG: hypothetical protein JXB40_04075 [Candidatus Omnitrophica bacterium]|nr:hypothetical protein [Candidatus Omnitrophota bacterium]
MDSLKLPVKLKSVLDAFIDRLKNCYGDGLISAILYGSASSGEFSDKYSNLNIMIVLDDTGLKNLSKIRPIINSPKFGMITPIFFTEEFIKNSLDVFPIEFLDIKENYLVLHGKDVISGLVTDAKNLRFQCEHELKSKLINVRKGYIDIGNQAELERLLFRTFTSAIHIMRNLLRLKGINPPYPKEAVLSESEKVFGIDTTVLREILWAKNKKMRLSRNDADALLAALVKELEILSAAVDKL